jgi:hypothetical protein
MARASVRPDRQLRRHSYEGFAVTRKSCGWGQQARRWAVGTGALATLCALGFVAPSALADDLPGLPTTSLPTLPTTLPPPLGSTTAATTTTAETTTSPSAGTAAPADPGGGSSTSVAAPSTSVAAPSSGAAAPASAPPAATTTSSGAAAPDGAVRLASGLVSIPVGLVREPVLLGIERLALRPVSRPGGRWIEATFRVWDSRGYVVRGAGFDIASVPAGLLATAQPRVSADDGVVSLRVRPTGLLIRSVRSSSSVAVRAYDPSSGRNGSIAVRRVFVLRLGHAW